MKIVSDNLKNALNKPTTQRKGRILANGKYYDVYNVEYYADCYDEGNVIGNAIASQLDFDLPYMQRFDTFQYFDGVWTGNEYEYVDLGTFNVFDEKDQDEFNKHITAFDNLIKFNAPFIDKGDYPKTLFQELQNVCEQADVILENTSIPNGDFIVENNQFVGGENLKTVLKAICGISGNYGIIKDDILKLQLKNYTDIIIPKSQHKPMVWKRRSYGFNQVIIGMKDVEGEYSIRQDEEDIALNGVHKLVINDNPFAYTPEKREELIDELFAQVKGFGYVPYELEGEWLNYAEVGDVVTIEGIETMILRINGKSPKSVESLMSAPAIIDSAVDYVDNTADLNNTLRNYRIVLDRHEGTITQIASETQNLSGKVDNNSTAINNNYQEIINKFDSTASIEDLESYQQTMQTQLTANEYEIANIQKAIIDGVEKVVTSSGTFDDDGLLMEKTGAETSTRLNQIGVNVKDSNRNDALFAGYVDDAKAEENEKLEAYKGQTVVYSNNMIVENYMTIGTHSRLEDYEDGTGVFYTGRGD